MKKMILSSLLIFSLPLVMGVNYTAEISQDVKTQSSTFESRKDFNTKQGYAEEHNALYLGNDTYLGEDGRTYKAEYNQVISRKLISWSSGHHFKTHKFKHDVKKLVVKNNKGHDSWLNARIAYKSFGIVTGSDDKDLHFGENTPENDYDILSYNGDGDTSDSSSHTDWIFTPSLEKEGEQNNSIEILTVGILVTVDRRHITTDMYGLTEKFPAELKRKAVPQVKSNTVYYDVLYAI